MKRLDEKFYMVSILAPAIALPVALLPVFASDGALFPLLLILFELGGMYTLVVVLMLWHAAWKSIQHGHARTTPGKAIGFLFIPFFNVYWLFQLIWGFAKDYNAYRERHCLDVPQLPEGFFLATCIIAPFGVLPGLGIVCLIVSLLMYYSVLYKVLKAVNALIDIGAVGGTETSSMTARPQDRPTPPPSDGQEQSPSEMVTSIDRAVSKAKALTDAGVKAASPVIARSRQRAAAGLAVAAKYVLSKTDSSKPLTQTDEQHYATALGEAEGTNRRSGVWAKALADANGNQDQARSLYIKYRVQQMSEESHETA